ncbi:MAG TPA: YbjN domain-containing protein [Actinomycetes bacterium]|nr:YbjN domain-containing protein [Actinomycetes bacterium]
MSSVDPVDAVAAVAAALAAAGVDHERLRPDAFAVRLPGEHKLVTTVVLVVGQHSLLVEAFVIRRPDENHEAFYRHLLETNAGTYAVHFCLDRMGDVYLTGRLPLAAVDADELDRVLGSVLTYADEAFDRLLEIGFVTSIRREWAWREKTGQSLANLRAFERFASQ